MTTAPMDDTRQRRRGHRSAQSGRVRAWRAASSPWRPWRSRSSASCRRRDALGRRTAPAGCVAVRDPLRLCGLGITVGYHRLFTHRSFQTTRWLRGTLAIAGGDVDAGPGDPVGDRPSPPPRPLRPRRRSAFPPPARRGLARHGQGPLPRPHGVAVHHQGHGAGRHGAAISTRIRSSGRIDRLYVVWLVLGPGAPFALGWAIDRQRATAARGVRVGGPGARVRVRPCDLERELDLPHVRRRQCHSPTRAATLASSRS